MMTEIKRRSLLKAIGLSAGAAFSGTLPGLASETLLDKPKGKKLMLTVPHITDVHIRAGENAPERFKACLKQIISKHKVDFFLNGGDSINDASYDNVVRNQVTEQWGIWDDSSGDETARRPAPADPDACTPQTAGPRRWSTRPGRTICHTDRPRF